MSVLGAVPSHVSAQRRGFVERAWNQRLQEQAVCGLGAYVINACTGTVSKHVAVFVAAHYLNSKLYDTTHPSSWIHRKNRWLKQLPL